MKGVETVRDLKRELDKYDNDLRLEFHIGAFDKDPFRKSFSSESLSFSHVRTVPDREPSGALGQFVKIMLFRK